MCGFSCLFCSEASSKIRSCLFPLEKEEIVAVRTDIPIKVECKFSDYIAKALNSETAHTSNFHCLVLFPERSRFFFSPPSEKKTILKGRSASHRNCVDNCRRHVC
jgi:hypothetical protein